MVAKVEGENGSENSEGCCQTCMSIYLPKVEVAWDLSSLPFVLFCSIWFSSQYCGRGKGLHPHEVHRIIWLEVTSSPFVCLSVDQPHFS